jgi:hypothetical protein
MRESRRMLKSRLRARLRPAQWSRWPDELPPFRGCRAPAAWPQTDTPVLPWTWRASPLSPWTGSAAPGLPWTRTETPLPPRTESAAPVRMCIGAALLVHWSRCPSLPVLESRGAAAPVPPPSHHPDANQVAPSRREPGKSPTSPTPRPSHR